MGNPNDPPESNDEVWQARTQIITGMQKTSSASGSDCLVVIYTREGRGPLGRRIPLDGPFDELGIGRDPQNALVLEFDSVSRRHARLVRRDNSWWVIDNNSTNGTYVNDEPTHGSSSATETGSRSATIILKFLSAGDLEAEFLATMHQMAVTDGLTQAANKRQLNEAIANEIERSQRHGRPLSLIFFDIDHFKRVNDTHGHLAGDMVLKEIANGILRRIRRSEVFGRYGGEEFALLLPETDLEGALHLAEEARAIVQAHHFVYESGRSR
ncbi:MAG: GGDEF domain-containing protein [Polyangiales bacterium]